MNSILIIEDDEHYAELLSKKFLETGWQVTVVHNRQQYLDLALKDETPFFFSHCLLDLNLANQSGLPLIPKILDRFPACKIVVLTGFSSVQASIEAIKLGAVYLLSKPSRFQSILDAFDHSVSTVLPSSTLSKGDIAKIEWEIIQKTLMENQFNISKTADQLGLHRRTLQRKLKKRIN